MSVTHEQAAAALKYANEIRLARSELKERIAAGETAFAEVLRRDEDFVQTMKLIDLLKAVPKVGPVKAQRALIACRISPTAPLKVVSIQRREELIAWVSESYRRVEIEPRVEAELYGAKGGYR